MFDPNISQIIKLFDETIQLGIHHICGEHKMLINAPEFLVYTKVNDLTEEHEEESLDLYRLVVQSIMYINHKRHIVEELTKIFEYLINKSGDLDEILEIVIKTSKYNDKDLEGKEKPDVKDIIGDFYNNHLQLQNLETKIDVGIYCFERTNLKEEQKDCAMNCLNRIAEALPRIIEQRANAYIDEISIVIEKLSVQIYEVDDFIEFLQYYESSKEQLDKADDERQSIADLAM